VAGISCPRRLSQCHPDRGAPAPRRQVAPNLRGEDLCSIDTRFRIFFITRALYVLILPSVSRCCSQELQGQPGEKFNRLTELSSDLNWYRGQYQSLDAQFNRLAELSSDLNWYRGQYQSLDALVEALQTDNSWLEYNLTAAEDTLIDQHTLAT
jgi:hypothetical protein